MKYQLGLPNIPIVHIAESDVKHQKINQSTLFYIGLILIMLFIMFTFFDPWHHLQKLPTINRAILIFHNLIKIMRFCFSEFLVIFWEFLSQINSNSEILDCNTFLCRELKVILVSCVLFYKSFFILLSCFFCIVCPSSSYGFWLPSLLSSRNLLSWPYI